MFLGLVQYTLGGKHLPPEGLHPVRPADPVAAAKADAQVRRVGLGVLGILVVGAALVVTGVVTLDPEAISRSFKWVLIAITVAFFAWLFLVGRVDPGRAEAAGGDRGLVRRRHRLLDGLRAGRLHPQPVCRAKHQQRRAGPRFPASWYQSLPPLFVILFAPVFAALWLRLGNRNPSSPAKFTIALILLTLAFAIMIGAATVAQTGVRVSPMWLVVSYLLQTLGELCLSPVGLSAMTRLAPARIAGLVMGVWFLALSVGSYLAGMASSVYETMPLPTLFTAVTA